MRRYFLLLYLFFGSSISSFTQGKSLKIPDYYGEKIEYSLSLGFLKVGKVDISFRGDSVGCGAYLLCNARSTGIVNFIKDIHYKFDACVDAATGNATQSSRIVKEGNYVDYDKVFYDRTSITDSVIAVTEDNDSVIMPDHVYDILVAFFQFRKNFIKHNTAIGTVTQLNTFFVDEEWDLKIKYVGKEKVETELGTANCFKFLPQTEVGRYFKTEEDMTLWVTANRHLIPVKIEVELKIGTLTADITSYTKPTNK